MGKKAPEEQYTYAISVCPVVKILPPTCIKKEKTEINYLEVLVFFNQKNILQAYWSLSLSGILLLN